MLKRIFLITMALLLVAAVSLAAGDKKEKFAKLQAELGLSDAQVAQLQQKFDQLGPIGQETERKAKALTEDIQVLEKSTNPDDQKTLSAKRSEREALTQEWHQKVRAIYKSVLTDEQFVKLDQMHSHGKEEHEQKEHHDKMI